MGARIAIELTDRWPIDGTTGRGEGRDYSRNTAPFCWFWRRCSGTSCCKDPGRCSWISSDPDCRATRRKSCQFQMKIYHVSFALIYPPYRHELINGSVSVCYLFVWRSRGGGWIQSAAKSYLHAPLDGSANPHSRDTPMIPLFQLL